MKGITFSRITSGTLCFFGTLLFTILCPVYANTVFKQQWNTLTTADGNTVQQRHEAGGVELGGKLYVLGGRGGTRNVSVFDPVTDSWTYRAGPPIELHHFQPVALYNKIWVIGAFTGRYPNETSVAQIYTYTPATNTWATVGSIPQHRIRGSSGAVAHDGHIYIIGGNKNGHNRGAVPWLDRYNPLTGQWQELPDAPNSRDHFTAAVSSNKLVVAAGRRSAYPNVFADTESDTDLYDFNTGNWSAGKSIPTPRAGTMTVAVDQEILVIGGETNSSPTAKDNVEAYDITTNRWRSFSSLQTGRHGGAAAVLKNKVHVISGSESKGGSTESVVHETLEFVSTTLKQPAFVQGRDLISFAFDHAPDKDDGHAAAAAFSIKQHLQLSPLVISGAVGDGNEDDFIPESIALMDDIWGTGTWLDAYTDWDTSVATAGNTWIGYLQNGGYVFIAEGGQSDFTAAVLRYVKAQINVEKDRIIVVQHSRWNEDKSNQSDLAYVIENATYHKIDDGNWDWNDTADLNMESTNFHSLAASGPSAAQWESAFEYWRPGSRVDFSDMVEVLWILDIPMSTISDIDSFANVFFTESSYNEFDTHKPTATITAPTVSATTTTFSGIASDNGGSGFKDLLVSVYNKDTTAWYNFRNNSFIGAIGNGGAPAILSNTTLSHTEWNASVGNLPPGNYAFYVFVRDNAGNNSGYIISDFAVSGPSDGQPPAATIDAPSIGASKTIFSGVATDAGGSGLKDVLASIYNKDTKSWYNFTNGIFREAIGNGGTPATLTNTTATSTNWKMTITNLPAGNYAFYAFARDNAGNNSGYIIRDFVSFYRDAQSPTASITAPVVGASTTRFSGTASDTGGSGFKNIIVSIYNRETKAWYNFSSGTFRGAIGNGGTPATLTNTTANSTNWDATVNNLPPGNYAFYAIVKDNVGNNSGYVIRDFMISRAHDTQSPTAYIKAPVVGATTTQFSGTADDTGGSGFRNILVSIYNRDTTVWYNFSDGSFSRAIGNGGTPATLTNTTASSTNWSATISNLSPGNYTFYTFVTDNAGNNSGYVIRDFDIVSSDTQSPSASIAAPAVDTSMTTFSGTASDTGGSGFNNVLVSIYNRDSSAWYNFSNGTFSGAVGNGGTPATLTNTTATSTNWSATVSNLPPGNYAFYAFVKDNAGNNSGFIIRDFGGFSNDTQ